MKMRESASGLIPERLINWHNNLSRGAKLFYYGVLGNVTLSLIDSLANLSGGRGSRVNLSHNLGDVASYSIRSLVAHNEMEVRTAKRLLLGANLLALSLTGWLAAKSGLDLLHGSRHTVEPAGAYLEAVSCAGNFTIAAA